MHWETICVSLNEDFKLYNHEFFYNKSMQNRDDWDSITEQVLGGIVMSFGIKS